MIPPFECQLPRRILFGRGRLAEAGTQVRERGDRWLLVTGSVPRRADPLCTVLEQAGAVTSVLPTRGEPTFAAVRAMLPILSSFQPRGVAAVGGGSVIDTAKVLAMLAANGGDPLDYAEVIGQGRPITQPSLPLIAVPTTAGTGAETTRNAVLADHERGVKVSLRSPWMVPDAVVLDADLLRDLPAPVMAATGMDALAQLIEAFVTRRANPFTDALCRAGIPRAAQALRSACSSADTDDARETLLLAACWSGIALANAGLGAVHGMAAVLGGSAPAPHGFVCAVLLAPACAINIARLRAASPPPPALERYAELARLLTGAAEAGPDDAVAWLHRLTADLPLDRAPLERMAAVPEDRLIAGALAASSMNGNPVTLDARDVRAIWQAAVAS